MLKISKILQQRLALAPMVTNSFGQYGPDQTFYNSYGSLLTTNQKLCSDFLWKKNTPQSSEHPIQQAANYSKLRGQNWYLLLHL